MALEARVPPNQSLYVQNLPEKLQKEDLRRQLYILFSTYGPVLDITAMKTNKMRGQAHVLFRDVQAASQAMRACQGFEFFGREMRIQYAKSKSLTLAKMTGTFDIPTEQAPAAASRGFPAAFPPPGLPAPPGGLPAAPRGLPPAPSGLPAPPSSLPAPPPGLPLPPKARALAPPSTAPVNAPSPQGTKRAREDSDEEAPMDEDDDGEGEMDMSDSD